MKQGVLIHPQMLARLTPTFLATLGTVQAATVTQSATGAIVQTWTDVAGLVALPCRIAPAGANERRAPTGTYADISHVAILSNTVNLVDELVNLLIDANGDALIDNGAVTEMMRFVADGTEYDIVGVEVDGNRQVSRLRLRVAR